MKVVEESVDTEWESAFLQSLKNMPIHMHMYM